MIDPFAAYEATLEAWVVVRCSECNSEFEMPRYQFEVDVEEEGKHYEFVCPDCSGCDEIVP